MKIRRLELKNIASFQDAAIDFTTGPLADTGLFLICGVTGAGKSSLLDSISIALYDQAPRLEQTSRERKIKINGKLISATDSRMFMRTGTTECWIKLEFEGNDGHIYLSEWETHTARRKVGGTLGEKTKTVTDLTAGTALPPAEWSARKVEIIGLTYEQFCRTAMLAQGEFSLFLKSRTDDKSAILEKLTRADIFGKMGAAIYDAHYIREQAVKQLQLKIDQTGGMSAEERAALDARRQEIETLTATHKPEEDGLTACISWLTRMEELTASRSAVEKRMVAAIDSIESGDAAEDMAYITDYKKSADIRRTLGERPRLNGTVQKLEAERGMLAVTMASLSESTQRYAATTADMQKGLDKTRAALDDMEPFATLITDSTEICVALDKIAACITDKAALDEQAVTIRADIAGAEKEVAGTAAKLEEARQSKEHYTRQLEDANASLQTLDAPGAEARRDALKLRLEHLRHADESLAALDKARREYAEAVSVLNGRTEALETARKELEALHEASRLREAEAKTAAEILERQQLRVGDWVKEMRSALKPGDECPVCGATVTSLPDTELYESMLADARDKAADADRRKREADKSAAAKQSQIKILDEDVKLLAKRHAQDRSVDKAFNAATTALEQAGLADVEMDQAAGAVARATDETVAQLTGLEPVLLKIRDLRSAIDKLNADLATAVKNDALAQKNHNQAAVRLDKLRNTLEVTEGQSAAKERERRSLTEELESRKPELLCREWRDKPAEASASLARLSKGHTRLTRDLSEHSALVKAREVEYRQMAANAETAAGLLPGDAEPSGYVTDKMLPDAWAALVSEAQRNRAESDAARRALDEIDNSLAAFLEERKGTRLDAERLDKVLALSQEQMEVIEARQNARADELKSAKAAWDTMLDLIKQHETQRPHMEETDTRESLDRRRGELARERETLQLEAGRIAERLSVADKQGRERDALERKKVAAQAELDRWERLKRTFGSSDGKTFRTIALSYMLGVLVRNANKYLHRLTDRYVLANQPGTFTLTVRDSYLGDQERLVDNLSGGETFIVSLAMALALSDIGDKLGVDMMFIDEGFGSLSGDLRANAVETLRALQRSSGRKVGVISHVDTLKENIPVQLQIHGGAPGSPSTIELTAEL